MKICENISTQNDNILYLEHRLKEAKLLFFVDGFFIQRWVIKKDRVLWEEKGFSLYKTNTYRARKLLNSIPLLKPYAGAVGSFFFFSHSRNIKNWKTVLEILKMPLENTQPAFAIQNKMVLGQDRLNIVESLLTKGHIGGPLNYNPVFSLIKSLLLFLTTHIKYKTQTKLKY